MKLTVLNSNTEKPERAEFFTRLAEKYSALHPNVTIEVTSTSFTDVNTNILTAINAGTPYDVFTSTSPIWINKGVVLNLKPYLDADGGAWAKELYPSIVEGLTQPDGGVYAMSLWMDTTPLLFHKEILAKLNLKVPTTTEEFFAVCEALKVAGYIPFQVHGSMSDDLLNLFAWQFAAKYKVKAYDVVQGKVPLTDPFFVDALKFYKDMNDRGYLPPNFWAMGGTEGRTGYATSKMAMRFGFYWDVDTQKDMGMPYDNQGVAAFPNITGVARPEGVQDPGAAGRHGLQGHEEPRARGRLRPVHDQQGEPGRHGLQVLRPVPQRHADGQQVGEALPVRAVVHRRRGLGRGHPVLRRRRVAEVRRRVDAAAAAAHAGQGHGRAGRCRAREAAHQQVTVGRASLDDGGTGPSGPVPPLMNKLTQRGAAPLGILFVLPAVALIVFCGAIPIVNGIRYSLTSWDGVSRAALRGARQLRDGDLPRPGAPAGAAEHPRARGVLRRPAARAGLRGRQPPVPAQGIHGRGGQGRALHALHPVLRRGRRAVLLRVRDLGPRAC